MNSTLKIFLIALLPVAAVVTSCQDDDDWKPTWALPIVKEQTLCIGDFISTEQVAEVNKQVKTEWTSYVQNSFSDGDSTNIDSIAFAVLASEDSTYVTFAQGAPKLNDSTEKLIEKHLSETGKTETEIQGKIEQINDFLKAYYNALPQSESPTQNPGKARAKPRAETSGNKYYGGDSVVNNLLDAMIDPTDVFVTAANLLSTMGTSYLDSINSQIDSLLEKANMTDTIALDLAKNIGAEASITALEIGLAVTVDTTLPFEITLKASFIDVESSESSIIDRTFSKGEKIDHTKTFSDDAELDDIVKSKGVILSVSCKRSAPITEATLRNLSKGAISFSLRVKIQAPMNKLDF
jgi:hypothetical protein